jgi:hypothetical protein
MANRYTTQFVKTLSKGITVLYARVTFGAAGAPTIDRTGFQSQGIVSVTRNGTGLYTIVFGTQAGMLDVYFKLLLVKHSFDESGNAGVAPVAPGMFLVANAVSTPASCSLQVQFNAAGVATDPASTEAVFLEFTLKNSTAP